MLRFGMRWRLLNSEQTDVLLYQWLLEWLVWTKVVHSQPGILPLPISGAVLRQGVIIHCYEDTLIHEVLMVTYFDLA